MSEKPIKEPKAQRKQQLSIRLPASLLSRLNEFSSSEDRSLSYAIQSMLETGLSTSALPEKQSTERGLIHAGQLEVSLTDDIVDRISRAAAYDDRTPENLTTHLIKKGLKELEQEMNAQKSGTGMPSKFVGTQP